MAGSTPSLTVKLSPGASAELRAIYAYNADHRRSAQADKYEDFLLDGIDKLATNYMAGRPIRGFPDLWGITLRPRSGGHGHVVIYRVDQAAQP